MVHRTSNSLLLTNLISQETLYSSSLSSLLNTSHVSITLYEAYAASSSADVAQLVMSVVEAMRAVDDALRGYDEKVKEGREVLKSVEKLEEEVGNVARDRDILINRLIKASKSTKRASIPHSNSSSSFPSPFSSTATSSKLNAAQAELQACEAHLTAKERELEKRRGDVVEQALMGRCRGIVECGQVWVERGQRALRVLEQAPSSAREANDPDRRPLFLHSPFQLYQSPVAGSSAQSHNSQTQPRQVHTPPLSTSGTGSAGSGKPLPQVHQNDTNRMSYISSNASFVSLSQYSTSTATSSLAPSQSVSQVNGNDAVDIGLRSSTAADHEEKVEADASPRFSSPSSSSPTSPPSQPPALLPLPHPNTDVVDLNAPRPESQHIYSNAEFLDVGGSINSHATTTTETGETATTRTNTQDHTADNLNGVQHPHLRQPSPLQHLQHHLNIPPAHAISELALPTSMSLPSLTPLTNTSTPSLPVTPTSRWLLGGRRDSWRERRESWSHGGGMRRSYLSESEGQRGAGEGVIAVGGSVGGGISKGAGASGSQIKVNNSEEQPERGEVEEDSSDDEDEDPRVVVVENPRFATGKSSKKAKEVNGVGIGRRGGGEGMSPTKRERRTSLGMGFFGSIRGLFSHGSPTKDSPGKAHSHQGDQRPGGDTVDDDEREEGGGGFFKRGGKRGGKWETRTSDNLKDMMRKGKGRDSDSEVGGGGGLGEMFSSPSRSSMQTVTAHNTPGSTASFSGGVGIGGATIRRPSMNGSTSTLGATGSPGGARNKLRKGQGKKAKKNRGKTSMDDVNAKGGGGVGSRDADRGIDVAKGDSNGPSRDPKRTLSTKRPTTVLQVTPSPTKPLAPAPPPQSSSPSRNYPSGGIGGSTKSDLQRKASLSSAMSVPIISALGSSTSNVGSGKGHRRASSVGHGAGAGSRMPTQAYGGARGSIDEGMTLLTIVEDMARLNRMASANRGRSGLGSDGRAAVGGPSVTASSGSQTLTRSKSKSHSTIPSTSNTASSALSGGLVGLMAIKAPQSIGRRELENELAGNTERQSPSSHTKSLSHSSRNDDLPPNSQSPRQNDISKRSHANTNTNGNAVTPFTIPQAPGSVLHTSAASSSTSRPQAGSSSPIASTLALPPRSSSPLATTSTTIHSGSPRGSLDSGVSGSSAVGRSRPAKSPLKSALKNSSSRSPSPMMNGRIPPSTSAVGGSFGATGAVVAQSQVGVKPAVRDLDEDGRIAVGNERRRSLKGKGKGKAKAVDPNIINDGDQDDSDSDSASYETVHEALTADEDSDGEDNEPSYRPGTGAVPSNVEGPHTHPHFEAIEYHNSFHKDDDTPRIGAANGRSAMAMSDISSASASTTTMNSSPSPHSHKPLPPLGMTPESQSIGAAAVQEVEEKVQRRKSVRVSLKPSYAAPPAVNEEEDEEAEGGNQEDVINNGEVIDMWKDSSDEDLEYERAKKRLSRAGDTKKGSKKRSKEPKDVAH